MDDSTLRKFIDDNLQPTENFNKECNGKMDELAEFLKTGTPFSVSEVFKVGLMVLSNNRLLEWAKKPPFFHCNNFVYSQRTFIILAQCQ